MRTAYFLESPERLWRQAVRKRLFRKHGDCHYCGVALRRFRDATLDHKTPLSKGGLDREDNCVLACSACNTAKQNIPYDVFMTMKARERSGRKKP